MPEFILPQTGREQAVYQAILLFFSLKSVTRFMMFLAGLAVILFVFSILINAVVQTCVCVSGVWHHASPIEQLLILVCAFFFVKYATPVLARILRKGF